MFSKGFSEIRLESRGEIRYTVFMKFERTETIRFMQLFDLLKEYEGSVPKSVTEIGKGVNAKVYRADFSDGAVWALKECPNEQLVREEYENLLYLKEKAHALTPEPYAVFACGERFYLAMEFYDGISSDNAAFRRLDNDKREAFVRDVVQNLLKIQSVTNDLFGDAAHPAAKTWAEYYKPFTDNVMTFLRGEAREKRFSANVLAVMERAYAHFDDIFANVEGVPTLTHGDYWMPNFIARKEDMKFLGAVDPFHLVYAEPEYELFALSVGMERKFAFLEEYRKHRELSENFPLKLEFYAIFSEGYWYSILKNHIPSFFRYKARLLKRQLDRFGLK